MLWPTNMLCRLFNKKNASNVEYSLESYKDTYSNDRVLLLFVPLQLKKRLVNVFCILHIYSKCIAIILRLYVKSIETIHVVPAGNS